MLNLKYASYYTDPTRDTIPVNWLFIRSVFAIHWSRGFA